MKMNRRGFTLIELLIVVGLIGVIAMFAVPRLGRTLVRQSVRGARDEVVSMHAKARAAAVQRGSPTGLVFSGNTVLILTRHPVTGVLDTVGQPVDLMSRSGVTVTSTRSPLVFDARGRGIETSATTITVSKGPYSDQIVINMWGRLVR